LREKKEVQGIIQKNIPQGLMPISFIGSTGTTEVVP
jgi:hypothetical protein